VVVQDTATAQACVALLRERHLGVATFLMLDQQAKFSKHVQEKPATPEAVPRLFDLVKVGDSLRLNTTPPSQTRLAPNPYPNPNSEG